MLPGIVREHTDDAEGQKSCGETKDVNERSNLIDLANNFGLFVLLVGVIIRKEELVLLISGKLTAISKQCQKASCECGPDDENNG